MINYGLCCLFHSADIKFKTYTLKNINKLNEESRDLAQEKIFSVWQNNITMLQKAINYCHSHTINSYRVSSDLFPHFYNLLDLGIISESDIEQYRKKLSCIKNPGIMLSMHPGQFVNIGSPNEVVVANSIKELDYHLFIAKAIGCSEINIHIGGVYGNKEAAISRFKYNISNMLSSEDLKFITIENDELNYSILEVMQVCKELHIRPTFDIHHQRCFELSGSDAVDIADTIERCNLIWAGLGYDYQRVHISSPKDGYSTSSKSRPHHDYIDPSDFEIFLNCSYNVPIHIDVEAKHKETAIFNLKAQVNAMRKIA